MIRGLMWVLLFTLSQSVFGESLAQDASEWISARYPKANLQRMSDVLETVEAHSALNGLQPNLVLAVIATESGFQKAARSPSGAIGLMQVVPRYHREKIRGRDLRQPEIAIEVGAMILRDCVQRTRTQAGALRCYSGYSGRQAQVYVQAVLKRLNDLNWFQRERDRVRTLFAQTPEYLGTVYYD